MGKRIFLLASIFIITLCKSYSFLPLVHVYLAEKWMEDNQVFLEEKEKEAFIVGTLFPDIRYLGELDREETHPEGVEMEDICCLADPFQAGIYFHSFIDDVRSSYLQEAKLKEYLLDFIQELEQEISEEHQDLFLKLLEDELILRKVDRKKMSQYFNKLNEEECMLATEEHVEKWHSYVKKYFQFKPSDILRLLSLFKKGILEVSPEEVKVWAQLIQKLSKDSQMGEYFEEMITSIEESFLCKNTIDDMDDLLPHVIVSAEE